jgi:hypothetical protein
MKFLCVDCDQPMRLKETQGPNDGSLAVLFGCPSCGRDIAMLTNSMETQMVRSLGVKIGGRTVAAEPMEMVRASLVGKREAEPVVTVTSVEIAEAVPEPKASKCPFTGVVEEAYSQQEAVVAEEVAPEPKASKCPFTGTVNEAYAQQEQAPSGPYWTSEAEARIELIPVFVRPMVKKGIEQHAHERGYTEINEAVMNEVKGAFGM